ncbi:CbtA family protein [Herbaspirillum sp. RV1423]|uniref:CbtA family protein n=1 Tax=Herbaspirillum sp. RV1423 TaxID=1443993 RepID=UPI0004B0AECC|nr:CbtA family protein [Herbaspirillum sp. RV1423]
MINLAVLRRIASVVLLAGALAGLLLSGVQQLQVSRIILQAEVYEEAAAAEAHRQAHAAAAPAVPAAAHEQEHAHEGGEWEPANGFERSAYTVLANVSMAIGFALFLAAAIVISGRQVTWRSGLLWGVAGYLVFFVAPSLGLPPEVPGTVAAPLHARQLWWVMTAGLTAAGLGLGVYARHWALKLLGLALLVVPHAIGAPHPAVHGGAAPEELAQAFIHATALANGVFWLTLGGLTGYFYKKFA